MKDILKTAKNCRHFAMCKIDYLGTGICTSGLEKHYVSYYPQGRMDLYAALAENKILVTDKCIEIADTCDLCGKCDYQCYFTTEMKPTKVMKALKEHVDSYVKNGGKVHKSVEDDILAELRKIVGDFWATNDRAIALTYSNDLCPLGSPKMPDYVIMPNTKEEIAAIIKLLNEHKIHYAIRGNGTASIGVTITEGAVIDLNRMKTIEFDEKNWYVKVGPGVSAFELQKEAKKRGYRVNIAEPEAMICGNIMCSGIFSTFSATYGTAADNYINAEFVSNDGEFFSLNDIDAPNLFSFNYAVTPKPGICTSVNIKLHQMTDDETGVLVPFETLDCALDFAKDCAIRHIGIAIGVLGNEYISTFMSPTIKLAKDVKEVFSDKLGINFLVLVIGDKYAMNAIKEMGVPIIDQKIFRTLALSLPSLKSAQWLDILKEASEDDSFSYLKLSQFNELAETALAPSAKKLAKEVDPELRPFFEKLYQKPEMTDLVWLNMFRIVSPRMGREKNIFPLIVYLPIDNYLINEINIGFKSIAEKYNIKNDYGFITPLDNGKRCIFEYDYFFDQTDPEELSRIQQSAQELFGFIEAISARTGTVKWIRYFFNQGFSRKENFLYS